MADAAAGASPARVDARSLARATLCLVLLGAGLCATAPAGFLNIDENNYLATVLALRDERVTVPGTERVPPTREMLWFDPVPRARVVSSTPVGPTAPPLYAFLALPFLAAGVRGLIALQLSSFVLCGLAVYIYAAAHARQRHTPWLALATYVLCSYTLEYAEGVWPHALSAMLCLLGWMAAGTARASGSAASALAAGVLLGTATGIRYQNLVFALATGAALLVFSSRRARVTVGFLLGAAGPLVASAVLNGARLGIFDPFTKGPGYLAPGRPREGRLWDAFTSTWARVVDFASWPRVRSSLHDLQYAFQVDLETGAHIRWGGIKKAWLQSAPWLLVVLIVLVLVWTRRDVISGTMRRELRAMAAPFAATLGLFAIYGFSRTDAGCLNQRYLLDLMPLGAVALAWILDAHPLRRGGLLAGLIASAAAVAALARIRLPAPVLGRELAAPVLTDLEHLRVLAVLYVPLAIAVALALATLSPRSRLRRLLSPLLGAALGWALAIHVLEDRAGSRAARVDSAARAAAAAEVVARERSPVVFGFWSRVYPLGPLKIDQDLDLLLGWADGWRDFPALVRTFRARGRPVLLLCEGMLPAYQRSVLGRARLRAERLSEKPCFWRLEP